MWIIRRIDILSIIGFEYFGSFVGYGRFVGFEESEDFVGLATFMAPDMLNEPLVGLS